MLQPTKRNSTRAEVRFERVAPRVSNFPCKAWCDCGGGKLAACGATFFVMSSKLGIATLILLLMGCASGDEGPPNDSTNAGGGGAGGSIDAGGQASSDS